MSDKPLTKEERVLDGEELDALWALHHALGDEGMLDVINQAREANALRAAWERLCGGHHDDMVDGDLVEDFDGCPYCEIVALKARVAELEGSPLRAATLKAAEELAEAQCAVTDCPSQAAVETTCDAESIYRAARDAEKGVKP